jgi:hypothetical protein
MYRTLFSSARYVPNTIFICTICTEHYFHLHGMYRTLFSSARYVPNAIFICTVCTEHYFHLHGMYRTLFSSARYVPNTILHTDLQISTVKAEITNFSTKYREKLITHPNELTPSLLEEEEPRRLKRFKPSELRKRFP